jgi:hypothetical protein
MGRTRDRVNAGQNVPRSVDVATAEGFDQPAFSDAAKMGSVPRLVPRRDSVVHREKVERV